MRTFFISFIFLIHLVTLNAQETPVDSTETHIEYYVIEGDTVPRSSIDLNEVFIFKRLKFDNKEDRRRYLILRRKTRKVFPYASLAAERLTTLNQRLDSIKSKSGKKKYTKVIHKYLEGEFSAELKKLTRTKRLRSGWRAFWYNTTASAFDISMKKEFDPVNVEEDYLIEDILQRSFQSNILEYQPTALDFEFLELSNKWN